MMFEPDRYTVGWICPIHEEYTAARAFLDEIHGCPDSVSLNNINNYTLGKLGKHHVVMVDLPDGVYGPCSAASVARDLLHNFPSIRIGLIVGIGGGAPSQDHDIRLGDVVVSRSGPGTGGVIQLDFGKAIQDQNFLPTGFLNRPPFVLLTAVNGLKSKYAIDGHQLEEAITSVLEKKPRMHSKYGRPDPETDRLYKSSVVHPPGNKATCAEVCNNDPSALVLRPQRTELEDNPMIHYGLIASSNQLMKDALSRDKLAAEKDVLCFEMEAAGLMDHFPCLVIRGICDYSDSHKNKNWQGYAAMAAAAYAKDLLSEIPPNRVEAEKKISDIVLGVQEKVNGMSDSLLRAQEDQESRAIIEWLAATDYAAQQRDHFEKRQERTCEWLLKSNEFRSWLVTAGQTLFCPGIPGAGKTIATSIVVDHLCREFQNDGTVGIAFVFYSYQQPQTTHADLYSSLLGQLIRPRVSKSMTQLYSYHIKRGTRPSSEQVFNALHYAISEYSRVFIIIDALDECVVSDTACRGIIPGLFKLQGGADVNLFVTSRQMPRITEEFESGGSTILEIRARDEDIQSYVESHIPDTPPFDTPGLKQEIITAIVRATDGMFLLARLHLDSLCNKDSAMKIDESLKRLPKGSDAYSEAYDQAMKRIQGQHENFSYLAIRVLSWTARSRRPMRTLELQHALAVISNSSRLNPRNLTDLRLIVNVCAGLVTLDKESDIIRLVHYTTQEYFEQSWMSWFPDANQHIATVSLTYLTYEIFSVGPAQSWDEYNQRLADNSLYEYAVQYWGYHAKEAYLEVRDLTARFLRCDSTLASATQVLLGGQSRFGLKIPDGITGLHIAAYFGINEEVMDFLRDTICLDVADGHGQTALHWAVRNGQIQTIKLLLHEGLDVNATDTEMKSALHYAASQNKSALIQLLLEYGALIEAADIGGQTPLLAAAADVRVAAAKKLLSHGAKINALDLMNRNALHLAIISSKADSASLTELLLLHYIDFSLCDFGNMTPLHYAVGIGSRQIIDLLLKAGASINLGIERKYWTKTIESGRPVYRENRVPEAARQKIRDAVGLTPLHFAACIGHNGMTEYLLSKGANPNACCYNGDTPLHIALRRSLFRDRQEPIFINALPDYDEWTDNTWCIELSADYISDYEGEEAQEIYQYIQEERLAVINTLLTSPSIDMNIKNIELDSPLHTLKYDRCDSDVIVRKLLDLGADISACNKEGQMPLHLACKSGASAIVCDFLDEGCSINTTDLQGLNALHYAVCANKYDTVRMVLGRDEQLAQHLCLEVDVRGRTLLHHYLETFLCSIEIISVLLHHGARLNDVDHDGNTPLSLYIQSFQFGDRTEICHFLLRHGADALWTSPDGQNLAHLEMHAHNADLGVLQDLAAHGVDLTAKDTNMKGILHHGAIHGSLSKEILNFVQRNDLLRLGDRDTQGKTPLLYASEAANKERPYNEFGGNRWKHTLERLHGLNQMELA